MKMVRYGVVLLYIALSACSDGNSGSPSLDASNKHPANWLTGHRAAYFANPVPCRECHGIDLLGGITKIDCFNQGNLAQCHSNGHGPRSIIHPLPFTDPAQHGPAASNDLVICQDCHGTPGGPGSNPRFNVSIGSLATGCEASGCHLQNMAHPIPWERHRLSGNQANACALCHGATFGGSVTIGSPACDSCHAQLVAGTLPSPGQCISCHGNPPSATTYPNIAGSHPRHASLSGVTCSACHNGSGSGSHSHYSSARRQNLQLPAGMAFSRAYNARSGLATYSRTTKTCANVKCHGGQTTPAWGTILNSDTECLKCHAPGSSQYNGYVSGRHDLHLGLGLFCTDCHDMASRTSPSHFSNLSSVTFEQPPSASLRSYLNYNRTTPAPTCFITTAPPPGTQFTGCHSDQKSWLP